jgi:hypothetical protein
LWFYSGAGDISRPNKEDNVVMFKVTVYRNPGDSISVWVKTDSPKEAFEFGVKVAIDVFGVPPNSVSVAEEKAE